MKNMTIEEAREGFAHFLLDRERYGTRYSPDELDEMVAVMKATKQQMKADELADTAYVHGLSYVESIAAEEEKAEQEKEDETNKD